MSLGHTVVWPNVKYGEMYVCTCQQSEGCVSNFGWQSYVKYANTYMYIHLESQLNFSIPKDTVCEMYRHLSECMLANWKGSSSEIG